MTIEKGCCTWDIFLESFPCRYGLGGRGCKSWGNAVDWADLTLAN